MAGSTPQGRAQAVNFAISTPTPLATIRQSSLSKWPCRVAARYDKRADNFLGFVWVAFIAIMLA